MVYCFVKLFITESFPEHPLWAFLPLEGASGKPETNSAAKKAALPVLLSVESSLRGPEPLDEREKKMDTKKWQLLAFVVAILAFLGWYIVYPAYQEHAATEKSLAAGRRPLPPMTPGSTPVAIPDTPGFPGVGMYDVKGARCNAYGNCVAEGVRNSCAPTREARAEKTTFVFPQMSCGGYDDQHYTLVVYDDGTCLFMSACPANCP